MRIQVVQTVMGRIPALLAGVAWFLGISPAPARAVDAMSAERLLYNGRVFTAEPGAPYADSVGIRGSKVVAVGNLEDVVKSLGTDAERIDLRGRTLMPGFVDTHNHAVQGGETLNAANITEGVVTIADLRKFADEARKSGRGINGGIFKVTGVPLDFWLKIGELDAAFSGDDYGLLPVFLVGMDYHTGWANRAMREKAGLNRKLLGQLRPDELKYFGVGPEGEPNGFVVDAGFGRLEVLIPKPSAEEQLEHARAGVRYLNRLGITAWMDPYAEPAILRAYRELSRRGELTAHVAAFTPIRFPPPTAKVEFDPFIEFEGLRREFEGVTNLTVAGVKVFADGVAEFPSQTAAMSMPYLNSGKPGELLFDPGQFAKVCIAADRKGLRVHVHAIGDRAVTEALNGFAAARAANGTLGPAHTITHLEFVRPSDFPRFRELNVVASFQLFWASADTDAIEKVKPYLSPEIYAWQYPVRSILHAGGVVAGASDWPVSTPDVFQAIYQAETRRGPSGVLNAGECMPREAMFRAYTRNAAFAMGAGERLGSIAPGREADLVLLDRDVLTVPAEALRETRVLWTLVGGRSVFGSPAP